MTRETNGEGGRGDGPRGPAPGRRACGRGGDPLDLREGQQVRHRDGPYGVPVGGQLDAKPRRAREEPAVLLEGATAEVRTPPAGGAVVVRVPVPPGAAGEVRVRVTEAGGRRELRERLAATPGAPHADLTLPAGWARPGTYEVEVSTGGGALARALLVIR